MAEPDLSLREHMADAVLAVLATPGEAMIERGAEADDEHGDWMFSGEDDQIVSCRCGWADSDRKPVDAWHAHAILTAALADEKEARG